MKLLLDSSVIIEFLRGNDDVKKTMKEAESLYTNTLCAYEVLMGEKYSDLKGFKNLYIQASLFFTRIQTFPFSYSDAVKAGDIAAKLIVKGKKVDDVDIIVAMHALANGATVFTKDKKHFKVLEDEFEISVKGL